MSGRLNGVVAGLAVTAFSVIGLLETAQAQDNPWRVAKVSGEAWVSANGVQQASVSQQGDLRPGDSVRTGRNGRVLLVRGAESILVSPNSAISLPEVGRPGMSSVIQQAGSILLEVEKRNVRHFEVETPYLAAVVKGTRFRVSIEGGRARVDVVRGQVQVADFRSGQLALVLPGQSARASFGQMTGLRLSGQGVPSPIEQGAPRAPGVSPIAVPGGGLIAPAGAVPLQRDGARGVAPLQNATPAATFNDTSNLRRRSGVGGIERAAQGGLRISAPLGEVKLDIHKVTGGMARSDAQANSSAGGRRATVWGTGELNPGSRSGKATAGNSGNPAGGAETQAGAAGAATSAANSGSAAGRGNGNGNDGAASAAIASRGNGGNSGNAGNGNNGNAGNGNNGNAGNGNSGNAGNGNNGNAGNGNSGNAGNGNSGNAGNGNSGNAGNGNSGNAGNGNSGNAGNGNNGNAGNGNSGNAGNGNNGNAGNGNNGNAGNGNNGNGNGNGRRS